jgi:Predicted transcriptional regulators
MRELKYAILGLADCSPVTGYDITKCFNASLSKFWDAKHSQIYPELHRLLEEGLVEYQVTIQGEKMEKKVYSITEKGREELLEWLRKDSDIMAVPKDTFRLRLYFGDRLTREELTETLNRQYAKRKSRFLYLESRKQATSEAAQDKSKYQREYMLLCGGIQREGAYVKWLEECAEFLGIELKD